MVTSGWAPRGAGRPAAAGAAPPATTSVCFSGSSSCSSSSLRRADVLFQTLSCGTCRNGRTCTNGLTALLAK